MTLSANALRNIFVHGRRTSMRQPMAIWDALEEIVEREKLSVHHLCTLIYDSQLSQRGMAIPPAPDNSRFGLASVVRVFVTAYFRRAATDEGHALAGHGNGMPFAGTPFEKTKG
jgi:predicted DNA-binding ribbon-helix-helix protein